VLFSIFSKLYQKRQKVDGGSEDQTFVKFLVDLAEMKVSFDKKNLEAAEIDLAPFCSNWQKRILEFCGKFFVIWIEMRFLDLRFCLNERNCDKKVVVNQ
jgi:predicted ATP-grasp superfamily ATP-dependent carboligase